MTEKTEIKNKKRSRSRQLVKPFKLSKEVFKQIKLAEELTDTKPQKKKPGVMRKKSAFDELALDVSLAKLSGLIDNGVFHTDSPPVNMVLVKAYVQNRLNREERLMVGMLSDSSAKWSQAISNYQAEASENG